MIYRLVYIADMTGAQGEDGLHYKPLLIILVKMLLFLIV